MILIVEIGSRVATEAPTTAPTVVAISKNIPMRMLVKPSLT